MLLSRDIDTMNAPDSGNISNISFSYTEPLTAAFEIEGKVFLTDRPTLDRLNDNRDKGSLRVTDWLFAINLAMGRIKPGPAAPSALTQP